MPLTTEAGVRTVLTELATQIPRARDAKPSEFYDNSLIQELVSEGFVDRVFGK